jgi:hypothetical protein
MHLEAKNTFVFNGSSRLEASRTHSVSGFNMLYAGQPPECPRTLLVTAESKFLWNGLCTPVGSTTGPTEASFSHL